MARYLEANCRLCRREGKKLFLKGDRCYTDKCSVERRGYPPGQHGQNKTKVSNYGLQLREKQKVKRIYGLLEKQFKLTYLRADRMKGIVGENMLSLLERRLDNVIFRLGFANSRKQARQLVVHRHFLVNGRSVNIPSYTVKPNDVITVAEKSKENPVIKESLEAVVRRVIPTWLELDKDNMKGIVKALPVRTEIEYPIQEHLIIELYSK
ncbi:MAG: 30S ribosomal protein S4 [Proteobacteria bacterium]|nr:30S ribosomal protein S4 [Pseudomonadota bacterium]